MCYTVYRKAETPEEIGREQTKHDVTPKMVMKHLYKPIHDITSEEYARAVCVLASRLHGGYWKYIWEL